MIDNLWSYSELLHSEHSDEDFAKNKYGLPKKRKYPMPDKQHVMSAIRFFNYVSTSDEKELAANIIKRIKEYKIADINVGPDNRFAKYYYSDPLRRIVRKDIVEAVSSNGELMHYGTKGMKWGIRNYQNPDGSYKPGAEGRYYEMGFTTDGVPKKAAQSRSSSKSEPKRTAFEKGFTTDGAGGDPSKPQTTRPGESKKKAAADSAKTAGGDSKKSTKDTAAMKEKVSTYLAKKTGASVEDINKLQEIGATKGYNSPEYLAALSKITTDADMQKHITQQCQIAAGKYTAPASTEKEDEKKKKGSGSSKGSGKSKNESGEEKAAKGSKGSGEEKKSETKADEKKTEEKKKDKKDKFDEEKTREADRKRIREEKIKDAKERLSESVTTLLGIDKSKIESALDIALESGTDSDKFDKALSDAFEGNSEDAKYSDWKEKLVTLFNEAVNKVNEKTDATSDKKKKVDKTLYHSDEPESVIKMRYFRGYTDEDIL